MPFYALSRLVFCVHSCGSRRGMIVFLGSVCFMAKQSGLLALLRGFAGKVLDKPVSGFSKDQLSALEDLLSRRKVQEDAADLKELARLLKRKHVLDSISISQMNGSLLASSEGNGINEAITASALFNYVQSEIPKSEVILIKSKNWDMLFRYQGKIFILKAPSSLSTIELKVISKEVEKFLATHDASFLAAEQKASEKGLE